MDSLALAASSAVSAAEGTCLKLSKVVYMIEHLRGLGTEISLFLHAWWTPVMN